MGIFEYSTLKTTAKIKERQRTFRLTGIFEYDTHSPRLPIIKVPIHNLDKVPLNLGIYEPNASILVCSSSRPASVAAGGCVIGLILEVVGDLLDEEVLGPADDES